MKFEDIDPDMPLPERYGWGGDPYITKFPAYMKIVAQIRRGETICGHLVVGDEDKEILNGREPGEVASKMAERVRKVLIRVYEEGMVKGRNYFVGALKNTLIVRSLADDDQRGFAHSGRVRKSVPARLLIPTDLPISEPEPKVKPKKKKS